MGRIKFGTDGWRAVIAEDFTFANVARVAQATSDYWLSHPERGTSKKIVIGYDRRFLSDAFAKLTAEVLAGNGFQIVLTSGPTPTPAVSLATRNSGAAGGVMITASHNPPIFNGFKLKSHLGASAESSLCAAVEALLDRNPVKSLTLPSAFEQNRIAVEDLRPAHYAALKKLVDFRLIAKSGLRLAHEALFGVGAGCFESLLARTTCQVTTLNANHDPLFGGINPEPVEQNYGLSRAYLRHHPHAICVVTDGDADRVGGMDGRGRPLSTHQLICMLLQHFVRRRNGKGRMVKALTTTSMLDKMCSAYGLELTETGVGFKYIAAEMIKGGVLLGAEESGGIGFQGHIPERDGLASGLFLLEMLATERVSINRILSRLEKDFGPHRYGRIDTCFPLEQRGSLMEFLRSNPPARLLNSPVESIKSYDGVKFVARDTSWLMIRGSGTEPILRIYAEAAHDTAVQKLLQLGVKLTRNFKTAS